LATRAHASKQKAQAVKIALSFIRTMTVGFGVEPNLLTPSFMKKAGRSRADAF
jgi:F0F1-type ATP synthase assembly protein I